MGLRSHLCVALTMIVITASRNEGSVSKAQVIVYKILNIGIYEAKQYVCNFVGVKFQQLVSLVGWDITFYELLNSLRLGCQKSTLGSALIMFNWCNALGQEGAKRLSI